MLDHLKAEKYHPLLIGNIIRCLDDTAIFEFLHAYEGYSLSINDIIHTIISSLGSETLPPTELSLETDLSPTKHTPKPRLTSATDASIHTSEADIRHRYVKDHLHGRSTGTITPHLTRIRAKSPAKATTTTAAALEQHPNSGTTQKPTKEEIDIKIASTWLSAYNKTKARRLKQIKDKMTHIHTPTPTSLLTKKGSKNVSEFTLATTSVPDHRGHTRDVMSKLYRDSTLETYEGLDLPDQSVKDSSNSNSNRTNKSSRKKHIAVLPTVPKILTKPSTGLPAVDDFDPFMKYTYIPLSAEDTQSLSVPVRSKLGHNSDLTHASFLKDDRLIGRPHSALLPSRSLHSAPRSIMFDDSLYSSAGGSLVLEANKSTDQPAITSTTTPIETDSLPGTPQPITPYISEEEARQILCSGVPAGAGLDLTTHKKTSMETRSKPLIRPAAMMREKSGGGRDGHIGHFETFNDSLTFD